MKIIIFVREEHLENLNHFIKHGNDGHNPIEWYHERPSGSNSYMVTIDYDVYINLKEINEK